MTPPNDDPDDPTRGESPTPDRADDRRPLGRPLCRVFGGPTSHRVQFAGFESHPATTTDAPDADRSSTDGEQPRDDPHERTSRDEPHSGDDPPCDDDPLSPGDPPFPDDPSSPDDPPPPDDPSSGEPPGGPPNDGPFEGGRDDAAVRSAGSRAISAVLEQRRAALVRALDPLGDACWRDEPLEVADLREARARLYELETAIEEYAARACAGTDPWESAAEHVPEVRLVEVLKGSGRIRSKGDEVSRTDHDKSG